MGKKQISHTIEKEVLDNFEIWCIRHNTTRTDAIILYMTEKGNEVDVSN